MKWVFLKGVCLGVKARFHSSPLMKMEASSVWSVDLLSNRLNFSTRQSIVMSLFGNFGLSTWVVVNVVPTLARLGDKPWGRWLPSISELSLLYLLSLVPSFVLAAWSAIEPLTTATATTDKQRDSSFIPPNYKALGLQPVLSYIIVTRTLCHVAELEFSSKGH